MRTLLLVRHGETEWNRLGRFQGHTDIALNDEGRRQARVLAAGLSGRTISAVAASDLSRARETAQIIADSLGLPLVCVDHALRERSYGAFEGLTREECAARFPVEWAEHQRGLHGSGAFDPPGAEPRPEVMARLVRAVTRIVTEHCALDSSIVIVSHGGAMRAFLEATAFARVPPVPNTAVYELAFAEQQFGDPRLW